MYLDLKRLAYLEENNFDVPVYESKLTCKPSKDR